jgi:hypothetical protein
MRVPIELYLLSTEAGGRETALISGWRGLAWFGESWTRADSELWPEGSRPVPVGEDLTYGCELSLISTKSLQPGGHAIGEIEFLFLERARPAITPGATFELREGSRLIATAKLIEPDS